MAVTDYTTSDEIRSVLGVASEEIANTVIEATAYGTRLDEAAYALSPSLPEDFVTIGALPAPTALQIRFLNLVQAWATYQVAFFLLASVSMFAPQEIEASRDRFARIDNPYDFLRGSVANSLGMLAKQLLAVYAQLTPTEPIPDTVDQEYVAVIDLGTDPVTGV